MLSFADLTDTSRPLAILVHGFPDTPHTWRHLGPALAHEGWRVAAPWLRGYVDGQAPISAGTYARDILALHDELGGDGRCLLVGHDWGANGAYGAVAVEPARFAKLVTLAVPPAAALGSQLFSYDQARRSWYVWLAQQVGIAEAVMAAPGFWERLWQEWSPGYDATEDVETLRAQVPPSRLPAVLAPYRAAMQPDHADAASQTAHLATLTDPPVPTLYLHGANDGCLGASLASGAAQHLPAPGSRAQILPDAGHFLHLERPDEVARIVREWLVSS